MSEFFSKIDGDLEAFVFKIRIF